MPLSRFIALILALLLYSGSFAQDAKTSRSEERTHWVDVLHKLQANPQDPVATSEAESVFKRLIEVTDFHMVICPVITEQLEALIRYRALLARISGSGAACFGIYPDAVSAQAAAQSILREHPSWWVVPTKLNYGRKWEFNSPG